MEAENDTLWAEPAGQTEATAPAESAKQTAPNAAQALVESTEPAGSTEFTGPAADGGQTDPQQMMLQSREAQEVFEKLRSLRQNLETLKQSNGNGESAGQQPTQTVPQQPTQATAPAGQQPFSRPQQGFFLEETAEVIAAKEAIIEQAKRDAEEKRRLMEEEARKQAAARMEQQQAEEARLRAIMMEQEAERKRQEALEAEQRAQEIAEKKRAGLSTATPEELAAFFDEEAEAVPSETVQNEAVLQQAAAPSTDPQAAPSDLQTAPIVEAGQQEIRKTEARAIEEAKEVLLQAKQEQQDVIKEVEAMTQQEQLEREVIRQQTRRAVRQEQKAARQAERDNIRREKKEASAAAKAERKREKQEHAEKLRLEKERKEALAEMGAGVVKVKGVEITTEINEMPHFSWRDFFGVADRKERKTGSKAERRALKEERERRREEARAMAEFSAKKHAERYANSRFGKTMKQIKEFCEGHKKVLLTAFSVFLVAAVSVAGIFNYCTAYEYSYNGKTLGVVKEKDEVLQVTDLVQGALREETNVDVVIDAKEDITFKRVPAMGDVEIDSSEEVLKRLTYMGDLNVKAYGIYVDGTKVGAVESKEIAAAVMQQLKDRYTNEDKGAEIEEAVFIEKVEVRQSNTDLQDVSSQEEMLEKLCTSGEKETLHKVVVGETLADIAKLYSVTEEDILKDNSSVDPTKLQVGSTIVIKQNAPVVTVRVTERLTYEKVIEFETENQDSEDIYEGYTEIQQKGENGLSEVTSRIVSVNGEAIEETELVTTVKKEAVKEIVLVGVKDRPPTVGSGKYIWPIKSSYTLSSGFGYRWGRLHKGIDMACSVGTDIYAADGGTVTEAGYNGSFGYTILIDHQNGMETRYAHCSKLLVSKGDKVFQGQHIAESGNTGRSTGPHLHFEVHVGGTAKNPINYLP
ncbi:MAG: peptidoglycan DD-metalloendopeptidase family protein [Bacillota bacterium]|nr:peptidoglycan DD-metalloendopeptidase family protein [Bacillota bacterium]